MNNRGSVLLMALVIMLIAMMISTAIVSRHKIDIQKIQWILKTKKAYWAMQEKKVVVDEK